MIDRRGRTWYYGWNIVAATILSQVAANGLTYNTFSLFVGKWSADLHAPISEFQLSVTALVFLAALSSPLVGMLADRYPARRLFGIGLLGIAVFYFAVSMATAAWQIIALYGLLVPVALALCTSVTVNPLIARWFVRRLGLALGLSAFGLGMAGVLLPPLIAMVLPVWGWRTVWRVGGAVVGLVVVPMVVWVIRDRPRPGDGAYYMTAARDTATDIGQSANAAPLTSREVLRRRNFWLLVCIYLPLMAAYGGVGQNLAPYATSHGLTQLAAGQLLAVLSLAHVASTPILGLLSDRLGNRVPFVGLAAIVGAGEVILALGASLPVVALGGALVGFGGGVFTLLAAGMAAEFGGQGVGRAFGMSMLFLPVASLTAFAVARTQEKTGSYSPALFCLMGLAMLSLLLSLWLRERRARAAAR